MSTSSISPRPSSRRSSISSVRSTTPGRVPSPSLSSTTVKASASSQDSPRKHSIRRQHSKPENISSAIPISPRRSFSTSVPSSATSVANGLITPNSETSTSPGLKRQSSHDTLQNLAGPESSLPLPRRDGALSPSSAVDSIPEGKPMEFPRLPASSPHKAHNRRTSSPTRTLSRIPVSSVGNARALAEEGHPPPRYSQAMSTPGPIDTSLLKPLQSPATPMSPLSSPINGTPSKRLSLTPGGTTKVLADLQTGVINARNALENTKTQLRLSQRSVAQLTRQVEDLKEGRERLRLENEGLNNVVARKERLLQEVLERARTAESEAAALKAQLKLETTTSKRSIKEMESSLSQASSTAAKAEREYVTLRESVKQMKDAWRIEVDGLREDMRRREERWRKESEEAARRHRAVLDEVRARQKDTRKVDELRAEDTRVGQEVEQGFRAELDELKAVIERGASENDKASQTAERLAEELSRLRRLMQISGHSGRQPSISFQTGRGLPAISQLHSDA